MRGMKTIWNRFVILAIAAYFLCLAVQRGIQAYSDQSLRGGLVTAMAASVAILCVYRAWTCKPDPGREAGG
jgi:hypothetical protein